MCSPSGKRPTATQGEAEFTEQTGEGGGKSPNTGGSGENLDTLLVLYMFYQHTKSLITVFHICECFASACIYS